MEATSDNWQTYLKVALVKGHLIDFTVEVVGSTEKGDGFVGDVFFLNVIGTKTDGTTKNYNLVAKCGKKSKALRDKMPLKDVCENEIYVYDNIFPALRDFHRSAGMQDVFDSYPKCYGTYCCDNSEVIFLENLRNFGYALWDKTKPMQMSQIKHVIKEYGKLHATSAAMRDQRPSCFKEITSKLRNVWKLIASDDNFMEMLNSQIDKSVEILDDDIESDILERWKTLKSRSCIVMEDTSLINDEFTVILHGDCWNNNFMFQFQDLEQSQLKNVKILDWQVSRLDSPILDISYFLFACTSGEDLSSMDTILKTYYDSFQSHGRLLGSHLEKIYPFDNFLRDWKRLACFGLVMSVSVLKGCLLEKDDVIGLDEAAAQGLKMSDMFNITPEATKTYGKRLKYIAEYAVKSGLL